MKKILINFLVVFSFQLYSQAQNYVVNESGELLVNGEKIAKIIKTAKGSFLATTMPEFTIYDVNGKPYLLFERTNGKFIFLDDNKSYIPRQCNSQINGDYGIAKFLANEQLFTSNGFNQSYRATFIKKYGGFDASVKSTNRTKTDPINIDGKEIWQSGIVIGSLEVFGQAGKERTYKVYNPKKVQIASIIISPPDNYNTIKVRIYKGDTFDLARSFSELSTDVYAMADIAIKWLVNNNYL